MTLLLAILDVALSAAPWLLLGLGIAGLIKGVISEAALTRWVGGQGLGSVARAAVIGAPLPLCSCGAIPTALALHRGGADRGPTTAFLIGTPGIGIDSLTISYALLGPFMALARGVSAVLTAIVTGLLVGRTHVAEATAPASAASCGGGCGSGCGTRASPSPAPATLGRRLRAGLSYAFSDILDDISLWLLAGLLVAGALIALVPPQQLAGLGSGLGAMLVMAVIGIPMYLCATAATPIAAGLLLAGVSPGTVLVFLIAAPVTSLATLGVFRREMGNRALVAYLAGILASTVLLGLGVDLLAGWWELDIPLQVARVQELLPTWLEALALIVLVVLAVRPLRHRLAARLFLPN
ncbi:SO_0444 family Cu/Zn efflux transporter [Halomonas alkalicola]|uniref:SO_0444 family Cu/Zn efflux transporter n=1 Tax=Halomonas alkalicola TaxID=1930622 RepID=A0ABY9H3R4_9GAMM|nr:MULTISPECIES: SO_0444 family Cu/Zn efflux transporter [Halomonas]AXY40996.1 permease [Halomonas sp. JS92-SW72]WLI73115.1 SO_0444 family Cu/Zn efflux transporter [Halomonas alkalicola]